jgi:hypothetical protein
MIPSWLHLLATMSVLTGIGCAMVIVINETRDPQHMWIMNLVWPLTALYAGPVALWAYRRIGRAMTHAAMRAAKAEGRPLPSATRSLASAAAIGATHCGSGCALGDLVAEWLVVLFPLTLFGRHIFGTWVIDYVLAFLFGIAFQYFTIVPMRGPDS